MRLDEYFSGTGQPFLYFPGFVTKHGLTINAAIYVCFVGWRTRPGEDGWRHLSITETEEATGLTEKEQLNARKALVDAGWIDVRYKRLEHRLLVRITKNDLPNLPQGGSEEPPSGRLPNLPQGGSHTKRVLDRENKEGEAVQPPPISKPVEASSSPKPSNPHQEFIARWVQAQHEVLGVHYSVSGGKDGSAVKRLLAVAGETVDTLLALARKAWENPEGFWSKQAITIAGFSGRLNEIRQEIRTNERPSTKTNRGTDPRSAIVADRNALLSPSKSTFDGLRERVRQRKEDEANGIFRNPFAPKPKVEAERVQAG